MSQTSSEYRGWPWDTETRAGNDQILSCLQKQDIELLDNHTNCVTSTLDKRNNRLNRELILWNCGAVWTIHHLGIASIHIGVSSALSTGNCLWCWWLSSHWIVKAEAGWLSEMLIGVQALATHLTKWQNKQELMACVASSRVAIVLTMKAISDWY